MFVAEPHFPSSHEFEDFLPIILLVYVIAEFVRVTLQESRECAYERIVDVVVFTKAHFDAARCFC